MYCLCFETSVKLVYYLSRDILVYYLTVKWLFNNTFRDFPQKLWNHEIQLLKENTLVFANVLERVNLLCRPKIARGGQHSSSLSGTL